MTYKHLTFAQRCNIAAFWKTGYKKKEIAKEIGVSESTVSRELKRNSRWNGVYSPEQADVQYKSRRKKCCRKRKFTIKLEAIVNEKLKLDWSPKQISGYGKCHNLFNISHERIYQQVWRDKRNGGQLYMHLRQNGDIL